jgi:hypothetical protein
MLPLFLGDIINFQIKLEKGAGFINRGINFGHHYTATAYQ